MPRWDYRCEVCGETAEYTYPNVDVADRQPPKHCGKPMVRQPAAPNFSVQGFNAKNGYTASC